jgi:hypothetical protein
MYIHEISINSLYWENEKNLSEMLFAREPSFHLPSSADSHTLLKSGKWYAGSSIKNIYIYPFLLSRWNVPSIQFSIVNFFFSFFWLHKKSFISSSSCALLENGVIFHYRRLGKNKILLWNWKESEFRHSGSARDRVCVWQVLRCRSFMRIPEATHRARQRDIFPLPFRFDYLMDWQKFQMTCSLMKRTAKRHLFLKREKKK